MRNQLTEGKIFPVLIRFAVPVFLALLLQALYGAADLIIVGRFADAASVSAVSNGAQIMTTLTNVMASLAMGTTVLLGRKTGEHDRAGAGEILGSSIVLFTVLGIGMSFLVGFGASAIASIMKVPQEAFRYAVQYLQICGGGMFVITWYNLIGSVFRAIGDSRTPLIAVALACAGNIFGDLLLVAVFHMGPAGAGIATVASQALSVVISLLLLRGKEMPFELEKRMVKWNGVQISEILKTGIPIAIQDFLVSVSFLVIQAIVNVLGVTASAGVGVAEKVCAFIMLVPSAFMQSMAAFTAQNCGAGKPKRAMQGLKDAILASLCAGAVMSYISFFHGDTLAGFFAEDQQVVLAAADYLKAYAIDCVLTPVFFCCIGFFNGFRRTKFVMIQGIFSAFCIRIPIAYFMSRQTPVSLFRIGLSTPCSSAVQIILSLVYLSHLKRKGIAGPVAETENDQADQNQNRE